ncbi:MAG: endolytic transglycosylase MltG [Thermoleophilia bacterium]|nr:endolytic transglycosylase MltG [Thermoleophilia bacterium]
MGGLGLLGWLGVSLLRGEAAERDAEVERSASATAPTASRRQVLRIVFPEGFTREEMAARITVVNGIARTKRDITPRLSAKEYLRLTASSPLPGRFAGDGTRRSLEGFLFPATYEFRARTRTKQLVAQQLRAFRANWARVDLRFARSKNLTPYDVLIIASMIEKEVIAPEERALVASVIYNRLRLGMTLGIDATIRYALKVPATESLRESQLHDPNPYNTRLHHGLPPGPIANPGLASIQAAAHPRRTAYLYFVRKPDKVHHFFTASKQEFDRYQREQGY